MGTGLDSFTNPENIGSLYPFVGSEVVLAIIGILLWLGWHARQMLIENREYARAVELYREVGLTTVVERNGTEFLADEDEVRSAGVAADADGARRRAGGAEQGR